MNRRDYQTHSNHVKQNYKNDTEETHQHNVGLSAVQRRRLPLHRAALFFRLTLCFVLFFKHVTLHKVPQLITNLHSTTLMFL